MRLLAIVLCCLFPAALVVAQESPKKAGEEGHLLALESAWNQAEIHHDANAVAAIMSDNFISVDHHGNLQNKSQYLAGIKDVSFKPEEISNSATTVYLYGDVAVVTSAYRTKGTDGGKPFIHRGRFTDTWVKINGKWTCVADHETLIH